MWYSGRNPQTSELLRLAQLSPGACRGGRVPSARPCARHPGRHCPSLANAHCFWEASDYKKTVHCNRRHTCISANFTSCIYQTRTMIASCRGPLLAPTDQSALTTRRRSHVCLEISYLISSRGIIIDTSPSAWKYGVITCTNVVSDPANCTTRDHDDAGMGRPICM